MTKKLYRRITFILMGAFLVAIGYFYTFSYNKIEEIYRQTLQESFLDEKKDFLKSSVDHLVLRIDTEREHQYQLAEHFIAEQYRTLTDAQALMSDADFQNYLRSRHAATAQDSYLNWVIVEWNTADGTIVFDSDEIFDAAKPFSQTELDSLFIAHQIIPCQDTSFLIGISKEKTDQEIEETLLETMQKLSFGFSSSTQVSRILNYDGGEDYAVRLAYSSTPTLIGRTLSTVATSTTEENPNAIELAGLNKSGELFYKYSMVQPGSVYPKQILAYSKLYKDFDWIVSVSADSDDIHNSLVSANVQSRNYSTILLFRLLFSMAGIALVIVLLLTQIERLYLKHTKNQMEMAIKKDTLTGAISRHGGAALLADCFESYRAKQTNSVIMLFDIDKFKGVNDTYGHAAGDVVLKRVVQIIQSNIRNNDSLIRWGGDEFVLLFPDMPNENALKLANSLVQAVRECRITAGERHIKCTLSVGIARFDATDDSYRDAIKRADYAMYQSKSGGRNQATLCK